MSHCRVIEFPLWVLKATRWLVSGVVMVAKVNYQGQLLQKIVRCLSGFSSRWVLILRDCLSREQSCIYISTPKCLTNYFRCHHPSITEPGQESCNPLYTFTCVESVLHLVQFYGFDEQSATRKSQCQSNTS